MNGQSTEISLGDNQAFKIKNYCGGYKELLAYFTIDLIILNKKA